MSQTKNILLGLVVGLALLETGIGGLGDMFRVRVFGISREHGWTDGMILMLLAIVIAIAMK